MRSLLSILVCGLASAAAFTLPASAGLSSSRVSVSPSMKEVVRVEIEVEQGEP
jgi:hypothetical protein